MRSNRKKPRCSEDEANLALSLVGNGSRLPSLLCTIVKTIANAAHCLGRMACIQNLVTLCVMALILFTGCSRADNGAKEEKHFVLKGEVLAIDPAKNRLTVKHEAVEGLMPAMTMEFAVTSGDVANAKVGQQIRANLVPDGKGDFLLEKIWMENAADDSRVDAATKALVQETVAKGNKAYRDVGEEVPDFALYDQDNHVVESARFRGKQVMINFIFTRCPVANMCPASVARFQQTQRLAKDAGVKNLQLISITLDPAFDTPGILKTYALARAIDTSNYAFLTGPEAAIKSLLSQFGVIEYFEGPLLNHTLSTLLLDEQGHIIHRVEGSQWEPVEFMEKMKKG